MFSLPPLNGRILSLIFLSRLCPVYYLWTDGWSNLFLSMVLKLLCPVRHLWTDTLFSFPPSGPGVLAVKLIRLLLNSELWVQRIASLVSLSRICPVYYLWTDGCPDPIHHCSPSWVSC